VDTITFTKRWHTIVITNYDTANKLYVTFDGSTPVAAADDTYAVPVNFSRRFKFTHAYQVVKIIGNGGAYDVEAF
jgi:hypothetical protein